MKCEKYKGGGYMVKRFVFIGTKSDAAMYLRKKYGGIIVPFRLYSEYEKHSNELMDRIKTSGCHYHNIYVTHVTKLEDKSILHNGGFVCVDQKNGESHYEEIWKLCK